MNRLRFSHVLAAALLFSSAATVAQQPNLESQRIRAASEQFQTRLDEAARALGNNPRLKKVSEQKRRQLAEFVVGNMLFTLLHESAHGLLNQMELPVLGKEEDAADAFATVTMLKMGTALSHGVLIEASKAWFLTDKRDRKEGTPTEAYDAHGLDEQRAYQIVCLMVGSNKQEFKDLADHTNLPDDRQDSCWNDYASASWSWDKVLQPHRRTPEQPRRKIEVTYGPGKGDFDVYAQIFQSIGILEPVAERFADTYAWPNPLGLEMASCGEFCAMSWRRISRNCFATTARIGRPLLRRNGGNRNGGSELSGHPKTGDMDQA